ncbi:MAG: hypothetical protein ACI8QS_002426 [Planctomycetota bacterium]|jgi:hypothetical protein
MGTHAESSLPNDERGFYGHRDKGNTVFQLTDVLSTKSMENGG